MTGVTTGQAGRGAPGAVVGDNAQSHVSTGAAGQGNVSSCIDELHAAVGGLHAAVDALEGRFTAKSGALWGSRASPPPIEGHLEGPCRDVKKEPAAAVWVKRNPVWARVDSETDAAGGNRKDVPRAGFAIARTDQVRPSVISAPEDTKVGDRCETGVRVSHFHISGHSASVSPSSKEEKRSGGGYSDARAGAGSENECANTPYRHGNRGGSDGGGVGEGSGSGGGVGGGGGGGCWREYKTVRSGLSYWYASFEDSLLCLNCKRALLYILALWHKERAQTINVTRPPNNLYPHV